MTSFVAWAVGNARAGDLGITKPACKMVDRLKCHQGSGSKRYASAYSLYAKAADFCKAAVSTLNHGTRDQWSHEYYQKTPDHSVFVVQKESGAAS